MMRVILIVLWLLFQNFIADANQDYTSITSSRSTRVLVLNHCCGSVHSINSAKALALLFYVDAFNKLYFEDSVNFKIALNLPYRYQGENILSIKPKYLIGSNDAYFFKTWDNWNEYEKRDAIVLSCNTGALSVKEILTLLYCAVKGNIKSMHHELLFLRTPRYINDELPFEKVRGYFDLTGNSGIKHSYDFIRAIRPLDVDRILNDIVVPNFETVLKYRFKSAWVSQDTNRIDYYLQNNRYYVYDTRSGNINSTVSYYNIEQSFLKDTGFQETIAVFDNLQAVRSDGDHNYILIDDTTFYYYHYQQKELKGPFIIPPVHSKYLPFRRFERHVGETRINNGSILTIVAESMYGTYYLQFNPKSHTITVDTSSPYSSIKEYINAQKQEETAAAEYFRQIQLKKYYMLALLVFVIGLNSFLALSKRL